MKKRGVFITTYFSYHDALIQAYTLPYVRILRKIIPAEQPVYLFTIEKNTQPASGTDRNTLSSEGITLISVNYTTFGVGVLKWFPVLLKCLNIVRSNKIGAVHAWCTPGGIIGYFLSIFSGKPLVLDSFEPHAEVMTETGTWKKNALKFKILFYLEKKMARRATFQICCTEGMSTYALNKYGVALSHPYVKPACVDLSEYPENLKKEKSLMAKEGLVGKIVCVYAGKFGGLYLTQEVFDFFAEAYRYWGNRFSVLLLSNESKENIAAWLKASGLPEDIVVHKFVPHNHIPAFLSLADFGIAPYQPVPSRNYGAPIKVSEYFAAGIPVVITKNIAEDSEMIKNHHAGAVLEKLTDEEYQEAIIRIDELIKENNKETTYRRLRKLVLETRSFSIAEKIYIELYG